jgi:hypothetical protein
MWHRVALMLHDTVEGAKSRLTLAQFRDWCVYYSIEPWGFWPDHFNAGMICSMVHNARQGMKKHDMRGASDFMPLVEKVERQQTAEEMMSILGMYAAVTGQGWNEDGEVSK